METFDFVVVGAGPAGATFARLAGREHSVLLLDGSTGGKPCGGRWRRTPRRPWPGST